MIIGTYKNSVKSAVWALICSFALFGQAYAQNPFAQETIDFTGDSIFNKLKKAKQKPEPISEKKFNDRVGHGQHHAFADAADQIVFAKIFWEKAIADKGRKDAIAELEDKIKTLKEGKKIIDKDGNEQINHVTNKPYTIEELKEGLTRVKNGETKATKKVMIEKFKKALLACTVKNNPECKKQKDIAINAKIAYLTGRRLHTMEQVLNQRAETMKSQFIYKTEAEAQKQKENLALNRKFSWVRQDKGGMWEKLKDTKLHLQNSEGNKKQASFNFSGVAQDGQAERDIAIPDVDEDFGRIRADGRSITNHKVAQIQKIDRIKNILGDNFAKDYAGFILEHTATPTKANADKFYLTQKTAADGSKSLAVNEKAENEKDNAYQIDHNAWNKMQVLNQFINDSGNAKTLKVSPKQLADEQNSIQQSVYQDKETGKHYIQFQAKSGEQKHDFNSAIDRARSLGGNLHKTKDEKTGQTVYRHDHKAAQRQMRQIANYVREEQTKRRKNSKKDTHVSFRIQNPGFIDSVDSILPSIDEIRVKQLTK